MRELTAQRKLFVDEYIKLRCKNGTRAAINAGYSEKSAYSQASDLLKKPEIIEYLKQRKAQLYNDLRQEFIFDAQVARKVMEDILRNESAADKDRITVARDFLDRAGFAPTEKTETQLTTTLEGKLTVSTDPYEELTTEQLKLLLKKAGEEDGG